MIINNFEQIKRLLDFSNSSDYFYSLLIMTRNKDFADLMGIPEKKQSHRIVKEYYIDSLEYFEKKFPEIQKLSEFFSARAYINLNRISKEKLGLEILSQLTEKLKNKDNNYLNILSKSIGNCKTDTRIWIVDIDNKNQDLVKSVTNYINNIQPEGVKVLDVIPTVNGYHLLSKPFNLKEFYGKYGSGEIVVQKNNPTLLFYNDVIFTYL